MKIKAITLFALIAGLGAVSIIAQDAPPTNRPPGRGPGGPGGEGGMRRIPLMAALDTNSDGTIDATEIEQASKSLKTLDKNSDGKITPEELRPARPAGGPGAPGGAPGDRPQRQAPPQ